MYYVGMLEYHYENSYVAKVEDFCDAYPEDVDVFGIARDLVYFLQVHSQARLNDDLDNIKVRIVPTINSIDVLTFDAWNHFVENLPGLEKFSSLISIFIKCLKTTRSRKHGHRKVIRLQITT